MNKKLQHLAAAAALAFSAATAHAVTVVVDVSGAQSTGLLGENGNTVLLVNIGANTVLNSISWTVALNATAPSSLSEMQVNFGNTDGLSFNLLPDVADGFSGAGSYTGFASLAGLDLAAGADGQLRLEFHEEFDDLGISGVEGRWTNGTLTFDVSPVPEPASAALALAGLGLLAAARRARRG